VDAAGGWDSGDLWPIVDVELGGERNSNRQATASQVIDCTTAFAQRVTLVTGREVMLYGNGAMRDLSITDRMGCCWLWCPRYTPTLPAMIYERAGWTAEQLVLWQYAGDGTGFLAGYPTATPDGKKIDHNALVLKGGVARLRSMLWAESPA
jgi:GH25 family lysozyme M1 (1,4-beta-N-acetylmuramidase)